MSPERITPPAKSLLTELRETPLPQMVAFALLIFATFHCVTLLPLPSIYPASRAKVFTSLVLFTCFTASLWGSRSSQGSWKSPGFAVSLALTLLATASSLASTAPLLSGIRAFTVVGAMLSGFWCARLILDVPARLTFFTQCCYGLLLLLMVQLYAGYFFTGYAMNLTMLKNSHQSANLMMALSFAPLHHLLSRGAKRKWLHILCLLGIWGALFVSQVRTGVLLPVALCAMAVLLGAARKRFFVAALITVAIVAGVFVKIYPEKLLRLTKGHESVYYRAEYYPFALHLAKQHPWLGIGLRTPRTEYLKGYKVHTPDLSPQLLTISLRRNVTGENIFLTFMTGLGIPFTLIYGASLAAILGGLLRQVREESDVGFFHPLTLTFPISAVFLHLLVDDGLMHPQSSFIFHILIGLVPIGASPLKRMLQRRQTG